MEVGADRVGPEALVERLGRRRPTRSCRSRGRRRTGRRADVPSWASGRSRPSSPRIPGPDAVKAWVTTSPGRRRGSAARTSAPSAMWAISGVAGELGRLERRVQRRVDVVAACAGPEADLDPDHDVAVLGDDRRRLARPSVADVLQLADHGRDQARRRDVDECEDADRRPDRSCAAGTRRSSRTRPCRRRPPWSRRRAGSPAGRCRTGCPRTSGRGGRSGRARPRAPQTSSICSPGERPLAGPPASSATIRPPSIVTSKRPSIALGRVDHAATAQGRTGPSDPPDVRASACRTIRALRPSAEPPSYRPTRSRMTIYSSLGVRTLVNARGNATLAGGTLMAPEVVEAMAEAAGSFVRIGDLQDAASRQIADVTGAEAGYVTTGAAAALTLGAAAMLARLDPDRMDQLPETGDGPIEIVVQHAHRNPTTTSSARRAHGSSSSAMTRVRRRRQMTAGIGPATAGAFFHGQARGHRPAARRVRRRPPTPHGLPVLVDASMNLPPRIEPSAVHRRGRRPRRVQRRQDDRRAAGVGVPGRPCRPARLGRAAAAGHGRPAGHLGPSLAARDAGTLTRPPQHGIGRSMKTGKEEIVGPARGAAAATPTTTRSRWPTRWTTLTRRLADELGRIPGLTARCRTGPG